MTKQVDILSAQTNDTKSLNTSPILANKEVKQEASLFDKLLSVSSNSVKKDAETSSEKPKVDTSTTATLQKENVPTLDDSTDTTDTKDLPKLNKSSSLLDRLVLEAKNSTSKDIKTNENIKSTQSTQSQVQQQSTTQNTTEVNNKVITGLQTQIQTQKETNEIKPIVSNTQTLKDTTTNTINKAQNETVITQANVSEVNQVKTLKPETLETPTTQINNSNNTKNTNVEVSNENTPKNTKTVLETKIESTQQKTQIQNISNTQTVEIKTDVNLTSNETIKNPNPNPNPNTEVKNDLKNDLTIESAKPSQVTQATQSSQLSQPTSAVVTPTVVPQNATIQVKENEVKLATPTLLSTNANLNNTLNTVNIVNNTETISTNNQEKITLIPQTQTATTQIPQTQNNKLANDLESLNNQANQNIEKNEKVNISKAEIENLATKQKDEPKSLMDSLIEKTKIVKNQAPVNEEESKILKNTTAENSSKNVISNIYLSSQRNSINNSALSNKTEAINSVKDATTTQEVETSAKKLDLNVKEISVETKVQEVRKDAITLDDRRNTLDKILLNNNARHNEVNTLITKEIAASKVILESSTKIDNEVSLNVNPSLVQSIQSRIIGARQQMSSMMSDVARQMYENYKPPVTAFRINLNPATLGQIAITMKSDRDNGINISLNISNSATLDAFIDSQNSLRNALNKTFEDVSSFNLDFNSSDQNNEKSNNQEDSNKSFSNESDTQGILEAREKNKESEDRNLDYM